MSYEVAVIKDSVSPQGVRLTTFQVRYPHAIHKDIMTHRALSRNFQSFRAYPPEKVIEGIEVDPFVPEVFAKRVKGMGRGEALSDQVAAREIWNTHIIQSVGAAKALLALDIAKEQVNFVLQDLTWITGIVTATHWDNFWALRLAKDKKTGEPLARPEVYKIAAMMRDAFNLSKPKRLKYGEWHLPLVDDNDRSWATQFGDEWDWDFWRKVSVGRCARVSYLTHTGKRDPSADVGLHDGLLGDGHMSPFEHVATPQASALSTFAAITGRGDPPATQNQVGWSGNFYGWRQYRKRIPGEENYAILDV